MAPTRLGLHEESLLIFIIVAEALRQQYARPVIVVVPILVVCAYGSRAGRHRIVVCPLERHVARPVPELLLLLAQLFLILFGNRVTSCEL